MQLALCIAGNSTYSREAKGPPRRVGDERRAGLQVALQRRVGSSSLDRAVDRRAADGEQLGQTRLTGAAVYAVLGRTVDCNPCC